MHHTNNNNGKSRIHLWSTLLLILSIVMSQVFINIAQYERDTNPLTIDVSLKNSTCKYHAKTYNTTTSCNIIPCESKQCSSSTIVYSSPKNYFGHVQHYKCTKTKAKEYSHWNPLDHVAQIINGEGDCIKSNARPVLVGTKLIAFELIVMLNSLSIDDPSLGPGDWRTIIAKQHETQIRNEILRKYANPIINPVQLRTVAHSVKHVPYIRYFRTIFFYLYWRVWLPLSEKWNMIIYRMGGDVACIDWTYNPVKTLYLTTDVLTDTASKQLLKEFDGRDKSKKAEVAVLNVQNRYAFCVHDSLVPRHSEAQIYSIPVLAKYYKGCLKYSETPCEGLMIKHDGLEVGQDLGVKTAIAMRKCFGERIGNYVMDDRMINGFTVCYIYIIYSLSV